FERKLEQRERSRGQASFRTCEQRVRQDTVQQPGRVGGVTIGKRPLKRVAATLGRSGNDVAHVVAAGWAQYPRPADQSAQPASGRGLSKKLAAHSDHEPKSVTLLLDRVRQRFGEHLGFRPVAGEREYFLKLIEHDCERLVVSPEGRGEGTGRRVR